MRPVDSSIFSFFLLWNIVLWFSILTSVFILLSVHFCLFKVLELNCCWVPLHSALLICWLSMGLSIFRNQVNICVLYISTITFFEWSSTFKTYREPSDIKLLSFTFLENWLIILYRSLLLLADSEDMKRFAFKFIWYQNTLLKEHRNQREMIMNMLIKFNYLSITN